MNFICNGPELLRTGEANPLLWLCGAKATIKIGSGKPDMSQMSFHCYPSRNGEGHAQKKSLVITYEAF